VVVTLGVTSIDPLTATVPSELIVADVAFSVVQVKVDLLPCTICIGFAVNMSIFGRLG